MDNYITEVIKRNISSSVHLMKKYQGSSASNYFRIRAIAYWELLEDIDGVMDNTAYQKGLRFLENYRC